MSFDTINFDDLDNNIDNNKTEYLDHKNNIDVEIKFDNIDELMSEMDPILDNYFLEQTQEEFQKESYKNYVKNMFHNISPKYVAIGLPQTSENILPIQKEKMDIILKINKLVNKFKLSNISYKFSDSVESLQATYNKARLDLIEDINKIDTEINSTVNSQSLSELTNQIPQNEIIDTKFDFGSIIQDSPVMQKVMGIAKKMTNIMGNNMIEDKPKAIIDAYNEYIKLADEFDAPPNVKSMIKSMSDQITNIYTNMGLIDNSVDKIELSDASDMSVEFINDHLNDVQNMSDTSDEYELTPWSDESMYTDDLNTIKMDMFAESDKNNYQLVPGPSNMPHLLQPSGPQGNQQLHEITTISGYVGMCSVNNSHGYITKSDNGKLEFHSIIPK